ncbi:MAG: putative baseplate assembly protein [Chloroflexota bacterium]
MPPLPPIDRSTAETIQSDVLRAAERTAPEWSSREPADLGVVLSAVFARFSALVTERLNRAPERTLIATMDALGEEPTPAGVAQTLVAFELRPDGPPSALVPARRQVSTVASTTAPAQVFETMHDLNVVRSRLVEWVTIDPDTHRVSDYGPVVRAEDPGVIEPFRAARPMERALYVDLSGLGAQAHPADLELLLTLAPGTSEAELASALQHVHWSLPGDPATDIPGPQIIPGTGASPTILRFEALPPIPVLSIPAHEGGSPRPGRWIRASLVPPSVAAHDIHLTGLSAQRTQQRPDGIPPDQVLVNEVPVDYSRDFAPFDASADVGDTVTIGSVEGFANDGDTRDGAITIELDLRRNDARIKWQYWRGSGWADLGSVVDATDHLGADGGITFRLPNDAATVPGGIGNPAELLVRAVVTEGRYVNPPVIRSLTVNADLTESPTNTPGRHTVVARRAFSADEDLMFLNQAGSIVAGHRPLAVADLFEPFSDDAAPGAAFSVTLPGNTIRGVDVTLDLEFESPPGVELRWEYLSPAGWRTLGRSSTTAEHLGNDPFGFRDTTQAFRRSGSVAFSRPSDLATTDLIGITGAWIRARVVRGHYRRPRPITSAATLDLTRDLRRRPAAPVARVPVVEAVRVKYTATHQRPIAMAVCGFDRTIAQTSDQEPPDPLPLFPSQREKSPTAYLGLDERPPNERLTIQIVALPDTVDASPTFNLTAPQPAGHTASFEYFDGKDWRPLAVADGSDGLAQSGPIRFIAPAAWNAAALFDREPRCWLRISRAAGAHTSAALSHAVLNAIEAEHAESVGPEVVGSSNGRADQSFVLSRGPICNTPVVEIREPGQGAASPAGWVAWRHVATLEASSRSDRHFLLDRSTGSLVFGDGVRGMIPPEGRDSIRASYRTGGGSAGNVDVGAISELRTVSPSIGRVRNPIPAEGGAQGDSPWQTAARGPRRPRLRDRAVTAADVEALALEATGTSLACAVCVVPRTSPPALMVLPRTNADRPSPGPALIRRIEEHVHARAHPALVASGLTVVGPGYVPVSIAATVAAAQGDRAGQTKEAVIHAIRGFLSPIEGGPDRTGWPPGRDVHLSELIACIESAPGVAHVISASFRPSAGVQPILLEPLPDSPIPPAMAASFVAGSTLTSASGSTVGTLGEDLRAASDGRLLAMVRWFRERERIVIGPPDLGIEAIIRTIEGAVLTVEPLRLPAALSASSPIRSRSYAGRSLLIAPLDAERIATRFPICLPEPGESMVLRSSDASGTEARARVAVDPNDPAVPLLGGRMFVPPLHLAASGEHVIEIVTP